jgi:hypothetical protein
MMGMRLITRIPSMILFFLKKKFLLRNQPGNPKGSFLAVLDGPVLALHTRLTKRTVQASHGPYLRSLYLDGYEN